MLLGTSDKYSIKVYRICIMSCLIVCACAGAGASITSTNQSYSNLLPMIGAITGDNKTNKVVATEGKTFQISSSNIKGAVKIDDSLATHIPVAINGSVTQTDKTERNDSKNDGEFTPPPTKLGYDAVKRLLLVSVGITAVVVIYCSIQYIRLRRKKTAALKYGLLASHDEDLEMTPLEADEEEDETTLFDMKNHFVS